MARPNGNLSGTERGISAAVGLSLLVIAGRRGSSLGRVLSGLAGAALLARSYAGYCGVKSAVTGEGLLREGISEQWSRMRQRNVSSRDASESGSAAIDDAVNDSFPASDPPASRLPDEPPANAEAKWAAARAAGVE